MPGLPKLSKSFLCMKPGRSTHHCLSIYPLVISRLERLDNRVQHHAKSWRRYLSQVSLNSCTVPFWQHLRIFKLVSRQPARSACLRVNGQISSIYVIFVGKWAYKNTGQFAKNLDIYFNQNTLYCWTLPFSELQIVNPIRQAPSIKGDPGFHCCSCPFEHGVFSHQSCHKDHACHS